MVEAPVILRAAWRVGVKRYRVSNGRPEDKYPCRRSGSLRGRKRKREIERRRMRDHVVVPLDGSLMPRAHLIFASRSRWRRRRWLKKSPSPRACFLPLALFPLSFLPSFYASTFARERERPRISISRDVRVSRTRGTFSKPPNCPANS